MKKPEKFWEKVDRSGVHQQELADMFGVSQVAISLIIRKKTYV